MDTATFTERLVVAQWADVTGNVPKQQSTGVLLVTIGWTNFVLKKFKLKVGCCRFFGHFPSCVGKLQGYVKGV